MSAAASGEGTTARWPAEWLQRLRSARATLWRGVEAQHRLATMKLVDSAAEQEVLEAALEKSKPPVPRGAERLHYLLVTPFRYVSPWPSRFRAGGEGGVWYGAERLDTACAEVGYWRWRFAHDSDGLRGQRVLSELTFFQAHVAGRVVDLTRAPWTGHERDWMHPSDYGACHALAHAARAARAAWIRYRSVRDPRHGRCGAVLELAALAIGDLTRQQSWACRAQADGVLMRPLGIAADTPPLEFRFAA